MIDFIHKHDLFENFKQDMRIKNSKCSLRSSFIDIGASNLSPAIYIDIEVDFFTDYKIRLTNEFLNAMCRSQTDGNSYTFYQQYSSNYSSQITIYNDGTVYLDFEVPVLSSTDNNVAYVDECSFTVKTNGEVRASDDCGAYNIIDNDVLKDQIQRIATFIIDCHKAANKDLL